MNYFNSIVSPNIRRVIKEKGLKQYVVAERCGIPLKKFSDMLNGRAIIKADDVLSIANALKVTPNDLFKDRDST